MMRGGLRMPVKKVPTKDGLKLQDSVSGEWRGSVGIGKENAPIPVAEQRKDSNQLFNEKIEEIEKELKDAQNKLSEASIGYRFKQYSDAISKNSGGIDTEYIPPEEWDIVDISKEIVARRNKDLMLAELEDLKIEKEIEANKPKVEPKPIIRTSETKRTPSWREPSKKKTKKQKQNEFRLPLEKYGPQWLEISKLSDFASNLASFERAKVISTFNKLVDGHPNEAFDAFIDAEEVSKLSKITRKKKNQAIIRNARREAYKLLKVTGRESAIQDFIRKVPEFQNVLVASDTILALGLRDKLSLRDYDLLTWSWRVTYYRIHPEDPFLWDKKKINKDIV